MQDKTLQYRQQIRAKLPFYYHGITHLLINAFLLSLPLLASLRSLKSVRFIELLTLGFMLVLGNLAVWLIHKYPLHRPLKYFAFPYSVHTLSHHRYYTDTHPTFTDHKDFHFMFFPPSVVAAFSFIFCPLSYFIIAYLSNNNIACFFVIGSSLYFFLYEFMHFVSHLPQDHPILGLSFFAKMREHHLIHHKPALMGQYNFNIVFPLFDRVFRSDYKSREKP